MPQDLRLYATEATWHPKLKPTSEKLYCFLADPEAGHYHRILAGELYLTNGNENYCLTCAVKKGLLTQTRPVLPDV
jgi:hypothetical protein